MNKSDGGLFAHYFTEISFILISESSAILYKFRMQRSSKFRGRTSLFICRSRSRCDSVFMQLWLISACPNILIRVWLGVEFSLTCQHQSHEGVLQERAVNQVPEPLEVCEEVVSHRRFGLQQEANSGPELGCRQRLVEKWNWDLFISQTSELCLFRKVMNAIQQRAPNFLEYFLFVSLSKVSCRLCHKLLHTQIWLTNGAVFPVEASASAVAFVEVGTKSHTDPWVLTRVVATGIHCKQEREVSFINLAQNN